MLRAVLLDLGNVLVAFDHGITLTRIGEAAVVDPEALRKTLFGPLVEDFDRGLLQPTEFFREAERRAGIAPLRDELWTAAWRDIFTPIPRALALLPRLGVPAALVSNTNALHWQGVLAVAPEVARLDALVLSFERRAIKPEPGIFLAALETLGVAPREAVFADDRQDFVEAARTLGLDAFAVSSPESLEAGLGARGLLGNST